MSRSRWEWSMRQVGIRKARMDCLGTRLASLRGVEDKELHVLLLSSRSRFLALSGWRG
jgi:hypothetical protein